MNASNQYRSPFRQGAANGVRMAVPMTGVYFAMVAGSANPFISLLMLVLMLAVPLYLGVILRRDDLSTSCSASVGWLWIDGIFAMGGGALISSALLLVFLQWISPDFLALRWDEMLQTLIASGDPEALSLADDLKQAYENGFSISPTMFVMSILWLAFFSGSVISLPAALIVKALRGGRSTKNA